MSKTIILKAPEMTIQKERPLKASSDITPGMLCEYDGADVKPHSTADGNCSPLFATENDITGGGIDTAYDTDGETVLLRYCAPGVEVNALIANSVNVSAVGTLLSSAGDGTLKVYTPPSQAVNEAGSATYTIAPKVMAPVARALEAKNNTSGANARLKVEVL